MNHPHRSTLRTRLAALPVVAALLIAGFGLAACQDGVAEVGGPASLKTTQALDILPANAQMVAMLDMKAARESGSLGELMQGDMSPFGKDGSGEMDRLIRLTGFDPETDVDRIYLSADPDNQSGAMVIYARFDRERMERAIAEEAPEEMTRTEIEGVPAWIAQEQEGEAFVFALPNNEMMVAGTEDAVRAMLNRLSSGTKGLSADSDLMALVEKARYTENAWAVVRDMTAGGTTAGADPMGQFGALTQSMVLSMNFAGNGMDVDAFVVPRAGAATSDVADVARGAVSAMRLQAKDTPELMSALDNVSVEEEGAGVRVSGFMPKALMTQTSM